MTDECDHSEVVILGGSALDDIELGTVPCGPIVQGGQCAVCGERLQRRRRVDGWGPWRLEPSDP